MEFTKSDQKKNHFGVSLFSSSALSRNYFKDSPKKIRHKWEPKPAVKECPQ